MSSAKFPRSGLLTSGGAGTSMAPASEHFHACKRTQFSDASRRKPPSTGPRVRRAQGSPSSGNDGVLRGEPQGRAEEPIRQWKEQEPASSRVLSAERVP